MSVVYCEIIFVSDLYASASDNALPLALLETLDQIGMPQPSVWTLREVVPRPHHLPVVVIRRTVGVLDECGRRHLFQGLYHPLI